tara:strand:+ start:1407 stop:2306 length:900 start_codon:yes stop_codon:yes gene_type:complete
MSVNNKISLSILIPCYNWDVYTLIKDLYFLCLENSELENFEIICVDDASKECFSNNKISEFSNVQYENLTTNIGRSKIRNLMAKKAKYKWLLFIDADSQIHNSEFIAKYIYAINSDLSPRTLYYGSTIYSEKNPKKEKILHWKYGKKIESKRKKYNFSSHHFLIEKKLFSIKYKIKFNESIKSYGYEDQFFVIDHNLKTVYLENALYHIGLKDTDQFIHDTENALQNLIKHSNFKQIVSQIKIIRVADLLSKIYLDKIITVLFKKLKVLILKNLQSSNPSIPCLQFYKLGYFLDQKNQI